MKLSSKVFKSLWECKWRNSHAKKKLNARNQTSNTPMIETNVLIQGKRVPKLGSVNRNSSNKNRKGKEMRKSTAECPSGAGQMKGVTAT